MVLEIILFYNIDNFFGKSSFIDIYRDSMVGGNTNLDKMKTSS